MASNLRVDNIQPTTGTGIGIGTANGSVTFNADVTGGLNVSTGSVGVGTDNPEHKFHLYTGTLGIGKSENTGFEITIDNNNLTFSRGSKSYINQVGSGTISIRLGSSYTEVAEFNSDGLKFPSGKGIDFSATSDGGTSTPSELLDDYEEGSWNPEILGWDGTYSIQEGRYIKIGRMVHIVGEVRTDANAGNSFTNAWPGLSNMPFVNTTSFQGVSGSQRHMGTATMIGDISPSASGMGFVTFDKNVGDTAFFPNHISPTGGQNFQNTMINNPTTVDFGYRFNCTFYTD